MQIQPSLPRVASAPRNNAPAPEVPVNQDRLVDSFLHLTQIPGPTYKERPVADDIKAQLQTMGLTAKEDNAGQAIGGNCGNLLVEIPGNVPNAPTLMFASHMDTVPLAVGCKPIQDGDIIKTDGSTALGGDCRAGCSELLEATREVLENNLPHGNIQLLFSVGEEGGLLGAYAFDAKQVKAQYTYAVDAFGANEIYVQGRHLLAAPGLPTPRPTADDVDAAHRNAAHNPVTAPPGTKLTPAERKILDFTTDAMQDLGFTPKFHRIEWAASDANALREHGVTAISIGAGENNEHTGEEFVRISDMVKSTQLVKQLIHNAATAAA